MNTTETNNEEITNNEQALSIEQQNALLLGNVDALETEVALLNAENEVLSKRIEELENILNQKAQG